MKIGDRVNTPHGIGTIKMIKEFYGTKYFGVLHDVAPSFWEAGEILRYMAKEIKKEANNGQSD